jgi:hypothetical protein
MRKYLSIFILVSFVSMSCTLVTGAQNDPTAPSGLDIIKLQKSFMSSYYAERTGAPAGSARALTPFAGIASYSGAKATVPISKLTTTTFASLAPLTFSNYPEPGQTTSFTKALVTGTPASTIVYDITATTTYSAGDVRSSYVEEYYVQDVGLNGSLLFDGNTPDGSWTIDDPIVKKVSGAWAIGGNNFLTQDQAARIKMLLTFTDGSTRTETIVSSSLAGGHKFPVSAFDINGSLDLSQATVPTTNDGDANIMFSSIVQYYVTPSVNNNFWFWTGSNNQNILGIRYYTEVASGAVGTGSYTAYTTSYEKILSNLTTSGGAFTTTLPGVTAGSSFSTLAESVLRQQVVYGLGQTTSAPIYFIPTGAGSITTNMKTRVVDVTGNSAFYLTQLNSDYASVSVPSGNVDALLTANPTLNLFARTQTIVPASGILPFAIASTDASGFSSLATLFTSITTGTADATVPSAPPSTLTGAVSNSYSFAGQNAVGLSTVNTLDLSGAGTVEAWVYLNALTDTAGIIHNGVKVDFSDEGYSLQGWGASGQIGIILDKKDPNPSGSYDYVLSSTNLAIHTWYYIVATWDTATKKIVLYINGNKSAQGTMSQTAGGVRHSTDQVVLGSQLPSIYSGYGYFGLNGKIVGASVSAGAMTAAQIATNYGNYSGSTGGW